MTTTTNTPAAPKIVQPAQQNNQNRPDQVRPDNQENQVTNSRQDRQLFELFGFGSGFGVGTLLGSLLFPATTTTTTTTTTAAPIIVQPAQQNNQNNRPDQVRPDNQQNQVETSK